MDDAAIAAILQNDAEAASAAAAVSPPQEAAPYDECLFGEEEEEEEAGGAVQSDSELPAPAKRRVRAGRNKKQAERARVKKRARMLALDRSAIADSSSSSSEQDAPRVRKRRRILEVSSSDGDLSEVDFAQDEAAAPATPPNAPSDEESLDLDDILNLGEKQAFSRRRHRFADDEAEEASDDGGDGGGGKIVGRRAVPSAQDTDGAVKMDVRAYEFVSAHPPTMVFRVGKTAATAVSVTLAGDLVRDMSCPLHTFRIHARRIPGTVSGTGEPVLAVLDIEKVVAGPVVDAGKVAMASAVMTNSAIVGDGEVRVTVARLKRGATASAYLKNCANPAAYAKKLFDRLGAEFRGQAPLTRAALERFAPADGNALVSWMCRNALEDARFFEAANLVGGAAVRAIGRPGPATLAAWNAIRGADGAVAALGGEAAVGELLKTVHFANQLSEFRAARLHEALGVSASRTLADTAECIVRAAAVVHSLPGGADVQDERYRNAIVRSEPHEVWPEPMLRLLRWHGLHVDRDDAQRWYACRQQTRQFYATVMDSMRAGTVRFVRAEIDDDHAAAGAESGYVDRVRGDVTRFKHAMLVISKTEARVKYLEYHTKGYGARFMKFQHGRAFAPTARTVIWVDRAHTLNSRELTWLLTTWGPVAKEIYLAGSTWAGTTRYESTLFSQLFVGAGVAGRETLSATLAEYKAAPAGRDPLAPGALGGTVPTVIGRLAAASPPDVAKAFPHARAYSIAQLAEAVDVRPRAVLVIFDNGWTREDLATVWQHAPARPNSIWMYGGADWHPALQRSSRSNAGPAALIQKA